MKDPVFIYADDEIRSYQDLYGDLVYVVPHYIHTRGVKSEAGQ